MGQYWQYPYNQGIRPPIPGFYPGIQPAGYYPGMYPTPVRMPVGQDSYSRQTPTQAEPEKKQPWYVTVGKEALKIGAIVGASVLGGMFFGVPGALAAGAITSGAVSAIDQKVSKGKIDWGTVTIDTVLGAIPGGAGSAVVKAGQRVLGKEILKHTVKKAAVIGSVDGALMGYAGGTAHTAYDSYKKTGELDLSQANSAGLSSILPGAIGGAIAGGAFTAIGNKISKKSSPKQPISAEELAKMQKQLDATRLEDLPPPKRNLSNRIITKLRIRSQDPSMGIKNFHQVDDMVFRGAMPESPQAFARLKARNVDTIIDLRGDRTTSLSEFAFETRWAAEEGLNYHAIKMDSKNGPDAAGLHQLFWLIEDARRRGTKVYVHCRQGIERTGSMIGAYQMKRHNLSPKQAYAAMQENGYAFFHKKAHKDFVFSDRTPVLLDEVQESIALRIKAKNELNRDQYKALCKLWEQGQFTEAASQMRAWQASQPSRHTGTGSSKHHHRPDAPQSSVSFTTHNRNSHTSTRTTGVGAQSLHAEHLAPEHGTHHGAKTGVRASSTKSRTRDSLILPPPVSASDLDSSSLHSVPQSTSLHHTSEVLHSSKHKTQTHQRKVHSQRPLVEPAVPTKPPHHSLSSASTHGKSISQPPVQKTDRRSTVKRTSHEVPVRPVEAIDRPIVRLHVEPPPFKPMFEGVDVTTVHFQQGNVQDCFLLSAINTMQHHKDGAKLLGRIGMRQLENGDYQVKFPGYDREVTVKPASLEHPSLVQSETPQIRILEQAYKEMMYEKVRGGEPVTGQVLIRAMFGLEHANTLLAPFNDANRNTKTLLQTVFGESFDPHINQLDGDVLAGQRIGNAEAQIRYFEDVHTLIQQKAQLRDAFNSIPIEGPGALQPGSQWLVTLPSGRKVVIKDSSISDPTERVLKRMEELGGGNFEAIYKDLLNTEIRMAALKTQYSATFLDGAPVKDFRDLGRNIWQLPGGQELIRGIRVMDTDTGLKVKFPGSPREVLLEGQHIYASRDGRNLELTIDQVPKESQAQVIMQAMQQFEIDERFNRVMDQGQSEAALHNIFGGHILPDNHLFLPIEEIRALFLREHPEQANIIDTALPAFMRERQLLTTDHLKASLRDGQNHILTAKVKDLAEEVVLTEHTTRQQFAIGAAHKSKTPAYSVKSFKPEGNKVTMECSTTSGTQTVVIDDVMTYFPDASRSKPPKIEINGKNLIVTDGRKESHSLPIDHVVGPALQNRLQGGHIYSVLQGSSTDTHITIADPFDTRGRRYTFPIDDFMRAFEVGGVSFEGV